MKKFLLASCAFLLSIVSTLAADITSNLDTYQQIDCPVQQVSRRSRKESKQPVKHATLPHIRIKESTSSNWSGYASATSLRTPSRDLLLMFPARGQSLSSHPPQAIPTRLFGWESMDTRAIQWSKSALSMTGLADLKKIMHGLKCIPRDRIKLLGFP